MIYRSLVLLELRRLFSPESPDCIYGPILRLLWRLYNPEYKKDPLGWMGEWSPSKKQKERYKEYLHLLLLTKKTDKDSPAVIYIYKDKENSLKWIALISHSTVSCGIPLLQAETCKDLIRGIKVPTRTRQIQLIYLNNYTSIF